MLKALQIKSSDRNRVCSFISVLLLAIAFATLVSKPAFANPSLTSIVDASLRQDEIDFFKQGRKQLEANIQLFLIEKILENPPVEELLSQEIEPSVQEQLQPLEIQPPLSPTSPL